MFGRSIDISKLDVAKRQQIRESVTATLARYDNVKGTKKHKEKEYFQLKLIKEAFDTFQEDDVEEGNEFIDARRKAIKAGKKEFTVYTMDLTKKYILEESKKAEKKLKRFIDEIKSEFGLKNNQICLSGFSQGCMMSINLGLTAEKEFGCIVGFSGKIIDQEDLKLRKKNSTNTLLIHGEQDQVVSPNYMLEAKDFFMRNNIGIETHLIKNCDHHIPIEASSIALNYILKKIK